MSTAAVSLPQPTYLMIGVRDIHDGELLQVIVSHSRIYAILEEVVVRDDVSNVLTH